MAGKTQKLTLPAIRLSAKSALSLLNHILFFRYLASEKFYSDFKQQFERPEVLERVQGLARIIITTDIYNAYSPTSYERTFNLLQSFLAVADDGETANVTLYSDPQIAPAKLLPDHSYAEFFDPKSSKPSFLSRTIGAAAIRPFVDNLLVMLEQELPEEAIRSYEETMKRNLPPQ